jgi:hypothetical protein
MNAVLDGTTIDLEWLEYHSLNGGLVGGALLTGFRPDRERTYEGEIAAVLYSSVELPISEAGNALPPGVYVLRLVGRVDTPDGYTLLTDKDGNVFSKSPLRRRSEKTCSNPTTLALHDTRRETTKLWATLATYRPSERAGAQLVPAQYTNCERTTRCYGFLQWCRVMTYWYCTDRWYFCGFCFGFSW